MNAAITSGVIHPATTVNPTNLRINLPFPFIKNARRNPKHCCPIIPDNTKKIMVFFSTSISLGSLKISRKFLNPTNCTAYAELPVNEISVKEKNTVIIIGPIKNIPSSNIDGVKKTAAFIRFCLSFFPILTISYLL